MKRIFHSILGTASAGMAALLLMTVLAGDATAGAADSPLRLRLDDDIISLDPAHLAKPSDHAVAFNIFDGLIRLKAGSAEIEPNLAERWDLSADGRTYTFHLRKNIKWHKGYGLLTAHDFKYSFERIMDPKAKSRYRRFFAPVKQVEVVDDHTLRLELKYPYPSFLTGVLSFRPGWVVNRKAIEKLGPRYSTDPIGTGPFQFVRWTRGSEVALERNPAYYEPVRIHQAVFKVIRKDSVARVALERGDLDAAYFLEGTTIKLIKENPQNLNVLTLPAYRTHWLGFNLRKKALQDVRVRQAILHATDKKALAAHLFFGYASVVHSIFNPNMASYLNTDPNAFNPEKAKQLLKEAGHADGLNLKFLIYPSLGWPGIAAVLQEQWRRVGIHAEVVNTERSIYNRMRQKGEFDLIVVAISRVDADQYAHPFLHSANIPVPNYSAYRGADDLIDAARKEVNDARRIAIYKQFQLRIARDLPGFALVNVHYAVATRPSVRGLKPTFMDSYNVRDMYFSEK